MVEVCLGLTPLVALADALFWKLTSSRKMPWIMTLIFLRYAKPASCVDSGAVDKQGGSTSGSKMPVERVWVYHAQVGSFWKHSECNSPFQGIHESRCLSSYCVLYSFGLPIVSEAAASIC